ncbi:adenylate/guanylate cyclase domain-containing protein [Bradyrhizobium sp. 61]|uniref:CHASE2 domain-containing protein n=1 Tax=unclassified Bradyrhizobium TaxID=2631580 RepID=UPI001FF9D501|nr:MULTISPECIES: adenylate/guanylate cyclase domain-containing protein [unclassified Bradyrhizobium]MCK1282066.1 adenylate/guanylate cyclase domain-containing protein [Bradyrhizobium sp. 61]MCK1449021.1 adenylate/guanylate cyclase domain-containing protein [Bradyrhizobium sp. 48]MCK1457446.1 adenylate/guanylate cyclase domain-containing protein [Bradyrhizobium sp. 2]
MKRLKILRRWFARKLGFARLMCLALLVLFAGARLWDPPPIQELRLRTFDMFQLIDPRHKAARPVTIVDIDDKSLAKLGQWPWPRTRIADLIQNLTGNGAVTIGFDMVFSEADRLNPDLVASQMRDLDDATRARLRELPTNDQILADAIKRSHVVLGETGQPAISSEIDKSLPFTGVATVGEADAERFLFEFPGLLRNVSVIEKVAAGRGLFSIKTERDGLIRRVPLIMRAQGNIMPSLSLEILRVVTGTPTLLVRTDKTGIRAVRLKGVEIPTDKNGQLWVHYARQDPSIYISAADVLDNTAPPNKIAGKLVLVGTSAVGLNDIKTTPVSSTMPGVEIHAQVLESVLSGAVISQPNYALGVELIAALVIGLLVIIFTPNLGPVRLGLAGAMFAAILVGVSWFFYAQNRYLIDFTYPLLSTTAIYLTLIFASFVREQRQRVQIRGMFAQYMSPVLVEQLAQSPEKLVLGGEEREMTIMFSDVRGFTTISESYKQDPQGLIALMNRFLTPLTDVIIDQKGYIDKYMGDAIMAFWNAPLDDAEHEVNACEAAIQMLEQIDAVNKEREQEAADGGHVYIPLNVGIGLNTGIGVVGNMGSDLKKNYSVLGDSVNLASRLEGQSKEYGFPIIVGSRTALAAKDKFAILELDFIMVKGKTEPEVIYAIAGREDVMHSGAFQRLRNVTIEMLGCYRGRDWQGALDAIERGRHSEDADTLEKLFKLYEARIKEFQINPPAEGWTGAYALLTK